MKFLRKIIIFITVLGLFVACAPMEPLVPGSEPTVPAVIPSSEPPVPSAAPTNAASDPTTEPSTLPETEPVPEPETVSPTECATESPTQPTRQPSLMESLTLREKVGQLFLIDPDPQITGAPATELTGELQWVLSEYPVGGVVLFYDNIVSPDQLSAFTASLSSATRIPMFLAVDEEGGAVSRVASHENFDVPRYSSAASVGADGNSDEAYQMGASIGAYLAALGFNLDFAPVADIHTNPDNPIIGNRAFSADPETAAALSHACAEGLADQGIVPVFKHFPGHGDTAEDSHSDIAVSHKTLDELRSCEWLPYRDAFGCVMVGHIALPEVLGDLTPATFSRQIVTDALKTELGFAGLVITDSLSMGAVTAHVTPAEAALKALEAGCDILLMPDSLPDAFDGIVSAVESGELPMEVLDAHVEKILRFKQAHGIWSDALPAQ